MTIRAANDDAGALRPMQVMLPDPFSKIEAPKPFATLIQKNTQAIATGSQQLTFDQGTRPLLDDFVLHRGDTAQPQ